ncbi:hypothetical protein PSAC2689_110110 [Paraburkholderia sacchari]
MRCYAQYANPAPYFYDLTPEF